MHGERRHLCAALQAESETRAAAQSAASASAGENGLLQSRLNGLEQRLLSASEQAERAQAQAQIKAQAQLQAQAAQAAAADARAAEAAAKVETLEGAVAEERNRHAESRRALEQAISRSSAAAAEQSATREKLESSEGTLRRLLTQKLPVALSELPAVMRRSCVNAWACFRARAID